MAIFTGVQQVMLFCFYKYVAVFCNLTSKTNVKRFVKFIPQKRLTPMHTNRSFYWPLCFLMLFACQTQTATEETADSPTSMQPPATRKDTDITATTLTKDVTYQRQLVNQQYAINVTVQGEEAMKRLQIEAIRDGKRVAEFSETVDGQVVGSVTTDLNKNNRPEILVFVESSGSGSYGLVHGYELTDGGQLKITMPPLKGEVAKGYMGHDTFKVEGNKLTRTFPVYQATDVNASPTGGNRTVIYDLDNKLAFVMEKYSDQR